MTRLSHKLFLSSQGYSPPIDDWTLQKRQEDLSYITYPIQEIPPFFSPVSEGNGHYYKLFAQICYQIFNGSSRDQEVLSGSISTFESLRGIIRGPCISYRVERYQTELVGLFCRELFVVLQHNKVVLWPQPLFLPFNINQDIVFPSIFLRPQSLEGKALHTLDVVWAVSNGHIRVQISV